MIEEIITNNLPDENKVTYTADAVYNIVTNKLIVIYLLVSAINDTSRDSVWDS